MAIGNILGSNAFNMVILAVLDIASPHPVLAIVSDTHTITAAFVIITTGAALLCMLYRAEKRWWVIEPDAMLVALLVIIALFLVYLRG
jgi:cation:H+ antiporter